MFSYIGDTVLDPFLGNRTTVKIALELKRSAIGYEIDRNFLGKEKLSMRMGLSGLYDYIQIIERKKKLELPPIPGIQDAKPKIDPEKFNFKRLYKVVEIVNEETID